MPKKTNTVWSSIRAVFRGMKDTFVVVVLNKPARTDFTLKESTEKDPPKFTSDDEPRHKISDGNILIISQEHQQEIESFIQNHSNNDILTVPCYFNNEPCVAIFCVIPRVFEDDMKIPHLKDVIHMYIPSEYSDPAQAAYGATGADPLKDYKSDMDRLSPPQRTDEFLDEIQETFQKKSLNRFPGFPELFDSTPSHAEEVSDTDVKSSTEKT